MRFLPGASGGAWLARYCALRPGTRRAAGDDAPDADGRQDARRDGGTMSSRTGRCYLSVSLAGSARSARRPRCGSAKAATRTSAPQACLPGRRRAGLCWLGELVGEDAVQTEVVRIIASSLECVVSPTPTPHPTPVELDCTSASIREKNCDSLRRLLRDTRF